MVTFKCITHLIKPDNGSVTGLDVAVAERTYDAKFLMSYAIKTKDNGWTSQPAAVFYQEHPAPGHQHYFALFRQSTSVIIAGLPWVESHTFDAVRAQNGEIVISRFNHDFNASTDGTVWIDGGPHYTRTGSPSFEVIVIDGQFYERVGTSELKSLEDSCES